MITLELEQTYQSVVNTPSDINELLPILRQYTENCDVVLEAGVRWVVSTWAFLAGKPKRLISVDWEHPSKYNVDMSLVERIAKENGIDFEFRRCTTVPVPEQTRGRELKLVIRDGIDDEYLPLMNIENDEIDLFFIDTNHVYSHLKEELRMHSNFIKKYIIMHDTSSCGEVDGNGNRPGLWLAIEEFLNDNSEWTLKERYTHNNGLTVLERVSQ